jgi:RNase P subunit RPR2
VVALIAGHRRTMCPRCQTLMATFRWPGSVKQALWGGWTCPSCGCQMDRSGRELARQGAEHA